MPLSSFEAQILEAIKGTTADKVATWWPRWDTRECEIRAQWLASCDLSAIRATYQDFEATDFLPIWARVPSPVAFMYGAESLVVTSEGVAECKEANSLARYISVPGAGHMVFWDNPDVACFLLRSALEDLDEL